jgi:murein DD-endopeptidase MepM/ murein hydrolase activator NlpD
MLSVKAIDKIEVKKMKKEKTIRLAIGGLLLTAVLVSGITVAQIDRKQSARTEENAHTETAKAVQKSTDSTEGAKSTQETAGNVTGQDTQTAQTDVSVSAQSDEVEAVADEVEAEIPETTETGAEAEETKETSAPVQAAVGNFTEESVLDWPVEGSVAMDYSMDTTTYFQTLNVYKCNPAMIISAHVGDPVQAAADGTVSSIKMNEETGNTVTVDMGNGYEATYGQMGNLAVKEGDAVTRDTVLGYIEKTTKYYTKEGDNLYFAVTKDGKPVDPVQYMETDGE